MPVRVCSIASLSAPTLFDQVPGAQIFRLQIRASGRRRGKKRHPRDVKPFPELNSLALISLSAGVLFHRMAEQGFSLIFPLFPACQHF